MIRTTRRRLVALAAVLALSTAACSSLTEADEIRVDKDSVIAALKTAEPAPPPVPRAPAVTQPGGSQPLAAPRARRKGG